MKHTPSAINALLIEQDIEGLIAAGAPANEYEDEARHIAEAVNKLSPEQRSQQNIFAIVRQVWMESFDLQQSEMLLRSEALLRTVHAIMRD